MIDHLSELRAAVKGVREVNVVGWLAVPLDTMDALLDVVDALKDVSEWSKNNPEQEHAPLSDSGVQEFARAWLARLKEGAA